MIDLVYIASPSYSGSTLLTFLLNAHPAIATVGELKWGAIDLETYRCSCGSLLRECAFWAEMERRVRARGLPFDLNRPATDFRCRDHALADRIVRARLRGPVFERLRDAAVRWMRPTREAWDTIRRLNRAMMEIAMDLQGGRMFLDGSKDPVRLKYLLDTGDYNVRVIQLLRDGRAVVNSAMKNQSMSPELAACEWVRTHEQIERLAERIGRDRVLVMRYEDLCQDVAGELARVWNFLGVPAADAPADYRAAEHHILGNRMRLQDTGEIKLDEKWRSSLDPGALETFYRVGAGPNRRYGYD